MPKKLSPQQVSKVASLANLRVSPSEVEEFAGQLSKVLEHIERLEEVETSGVEPMAHASDLQNVLRADEAATSLSREQALQNAPKSDGQYFIVPQILDSH